MHEERIQEPALDRDGTDSPSRHLVHRSSETRQLRKAVPHWLLEGLFIVVSVALGFAVAQFGAYRADRDLVARVLAGFENEMRQNLASLEPFVPVHRQWAQALRKPGDSGQSGIEALFASRPPLPAGAQSSFPVLLRTAWDTAVASGALRLIDYELVAALSEVYRVQEIATGNVDRRLAEGVLSSAATYDASSAGPSIKLLQFTLTDIVAAEVALLQRYKQHLPAVAEAAQAAR